MNSAQASYNEPTQCEVDIDLIVVAYSLILIGPSILILRKGLTVRDVC